MKDATRLLSSELVPAVGRGIFSPGRYPIRPREDISPRVAGDARARRGERALLARAQRRRQSRAPRDGELTSQVGDAVVFGR